LLFCAVQVWSPAAAAAAAQSRLDATKLLTHTHLVSALVVLHLFAPHRYGHQPLLQLQRKAGWKPNSSSVGSSSNNIGCDFCNMAVEYIKLALHNNQTLEQIEAVRDCVT
jgi:hypothetical protein